MNRIRKGILTFGLTAALAGGVAISNPITTEAAEWEPRTVVEIEEDIQEKEEESSYTIQWGDTLGTIATAFDVSLDEITQANEISDQDLIIAGNTLHLSADHKTVSVEDSSSEEVDSFDVEEEEQESAEENTEEAPVEEETEEPEETQDPAQEEAEEEQTEEEVAQEESTPSSNDNSAKAWIAERESNDDYNATNGRYIGKYQLDRSYLDGDHSPENQERVVEEYVADRYGSWEAAKEFWENNGWY